MDSDNKKISQLTTGVPVAGDVMVYVSDPAGTPVAKKALMPLSGTWTPTGTTGTNVAAMTTYLCNYSRVGSHVTFDGVVAIDTTATGVFTCYLSLPIASDFTLLTDASGNGSNPTTSPASLFSIREDQTNNRLQLDGYATATTNTFYRFVGGYLIK